MTVLGYVSVSSTDHNEERQLMALEELKVPKSKETMIKSLFPLMCSNNCNYASLTYKILLNT